MNSSQSSNYLMCKTLSVIKKNFPSNKYFFIVFLIFKFTGLIILSNNLERFTNNSNVNLVKIFRSLTYFGDMSRENINVIDYNAFCFIIYAFLLFPAVIFGLLYSKSKASMDDTRDKNFSSHFRKLKRSYKFFIQVSGVITAVLVFLSQHVIEILSFPFILIKSSQEANVRAEMVPKLVGFERGLLFSYIGFLILNVPFILLMNAYVYMFLTINNDPYIDPKHTVKFPNSNYLKIILLIAFNMQSIQFYDRVLSDAFYYNLIMLIVAFALSLLILLFSLNKYIFPTLCNCIMFSLIFFCFYGSIVSIIMYFAFTNEFNTVLSLLKITIEVILVLLSLYFLIYFKSKWFRLKISKNIFIKNKQIGDDYLFELVNILRNCFDDIKNIADIFEIIEGHKIICQKKEECPCVDFNASKYYDSLKQRSKYKDLRGKQRFAEFKKHFTDIVTYVENEIINYIYSLNKNKTLTNQVDMILLHCDFIFYFKRNILYSLYLIQNYLEKIKNIPFKYLFYFYDYKSKILKSTKKGKSSELLSNEKSNKKYISFMNYYNHLLEISDMLYKNCEQFEKIISFQKSYSDIRTNSLKASSSNLQNLEKLFEDCGKLNKTSNKIALKLKEHFSDEPLRNAEICYLLYNFYVVTNKTVPVELRNYFLRIDSYEFVAGFESCYFDQKFDQPLIISIGNKTKAAKGATHLHDNNLDRDGEFIITYISQKLCDMLGYSKNSLLNTDFHTMIPISFAKEHALLVKKQVLIDGNFTKMEKEAFVLTKDLYYMKITFRAGALPSLNSDIMIICDISVQQRNENDNSYTFILDSDTNVITFTKNFEDKYYFTPEMFNRLNISFSNLFNINIDHVREHFNDYINQIGSISLEYTESLANVLSYQELKEAVKGNKFMDSLNFIKKNSSEATLVLPRQKEKLIPTLIKIKKSIEEQEYDGVWLKKLSELEKKFYSCSSFNVRNGNQQKNCFYIHMKLKSLGHVIYYQAKLYDHEVHAVDLPSSQNHLVDSSSRCNPLNLQNSDAYLRKHLEQFNNNSGKTQTSLGKAEGMLTPGSPQRTQFVLKAPPPLLVPNQNASVSMSLNESALGQLIKEKNSEMKPHDYLQEFNSSRIRKFKLFEQMGRYSSKKTEFTQCQKSAFVLLYIILFALLFLFSFNFYYKYDIYSSMEGLLLINVSSMILKGYIYSVSTLLSSANFRVAQMEINSLDKIQFSLDDIKMDLGITSGEMFTAYTNLTSIISQNLHYSGIDYLYNILLENQNYVLLKSDWSIDIRESNFDNEIHYFHFNTAYTKRTDSLAQCKLKDFFYNGIFKESLSDTENSLLTANQDEINLHYFIFNVLTRFTSTLETLLMKTNDLLSNTTYSCRIKSIIYNAIMLFFSILLVFFICIILYIYKDKIFTLLVLFLKRNDNQKVFERRLISLKAVIKNFDRKVCENFENIKFDIANENKEEKQEVGKKKIICPGNIKEETDLKKESNDHENGSKLFTIKIVKITVVVVTLASVGFIGILSATIANSSYIFPFLFFTNQIELSFLDRIPKFEQMLMYYRASILLNNPNFIKLNKAEYPDHLYYTNYYNPQPDPNLDSKYITLGDSKFSHIYYQLQEIKQNIYSFLESSNSNEMQNTKYLESEMNSKNYCQAIGEDTTYINSTESSQNSETSFSTLTNSSSISTQSTTRTAVSIGQKRTSDCILIGNGINSNGMTDAINSLSLAILDKYVDFVKAGENRNITEFLMNMQFLRGILESELTFKRTWGLFIEKITIDQKKLLENVTFTELVYSLLGFIFNVVFNALAIFLIIKQIKKFHFNFEHALDKLKEAMS